ncbi:hypothetical protein [Emticicia sp. C21]|uniref:hypothetical protein n=1 Tax=Emticicia sp. C21 TaxID=2302915 RepID=UPI000E341A65|nr:hypothetical protein [Emticicia sp. C21]
MPIYTLIFVLLIKMTEGQYGHSGTESLYGLLVDKPIVFKPDSSINKCLFLEDYESYFLKFFPNKKRQRTHDFIRSSPVMIFSDQLKEEYLIAYRYEGGNEYAFDCFEIGYFEDDKKLNKKLAVISKETIFMTESGLGLGSTLEEVTNTKGKNFKVKRKGNDMTLTYYLSDKHAFVKRYYMLAYFMEFRLRENKVRQITFGFEYP